jgi:predicted phage-related endonuclease
MENIFPFNSFLNEKKSYQDLERNQQEMVSGIISILRQVKDLNNREEMIETQIRNFKKEKISFDYSEFKKMSMK